MDHKNGQPKQLILLNFNDLVVNKPLIFSPFQLFDKKLKSEAATPISEIKQARSKVPEKSL